MNCGISIGGWSDGEAYEFYDVRHRKARKVRTCCECRREIRRGDKYEAATGMYEGRFYRTATCLECAEIRDAFVSHENGEYIDTGELWQCMRDQFHRLTTACFGELETVAAKRLLRERWAEWKGLTK